MAGNPRPSRQPQAGATPDTAAGSGGDLPAPEYEQAGSGVQDLSVPAMAQGFLYLVVIMDWVSRAVLAWRLSNRSAPHPTIPYGWIEAPIRRNSASCSGFRGPLRLAELTAILPGHPDRVPTLPRSAGHLGMELCLGPVETVSLLREGPGGSNPLPPEESSTNHRFRRQFTLPEDVAFDRLVDLAKLRWRIERDYQELKQELGLGDYEGRGWRGFHHHATLCIAAYGFLIAERGAIPPSGPGFSSQLSRSAIPDGYRPRGAADPTRAPHPQLDRHNAPTPHCRSRQDPPEMPLLQCADPQNEEFPITDAVRLGRPLHLSCSAA